jgi:CRISPR-associated protein Csm3
MKLEKIRQIEGKVAIITGLHIGASNETIEIGGIDNPIIKDPFPESKAPYIPGSSLKGKFRSLIEIKEGRFGKNGTPCDCGKRSCPVCPVFGTSAAVKKSEDLGPTRIVVRDAKLSEEWEERFKNGDLPMEIKYENAINRISGQANPRPLERVPAGVTFDFNISFKVFEGDPDDYFNTVLKAMRMLETDALGGSGSRGCGQINFAEVSIDGEKQPDDFLEKIDIS